MITFRYHVVTLVAVFMAIGLGVLFGATFIDQNIVDGLRASQARLGDRNEDLRGRIVDLEDENEALQSFAGSTRELLVPDSLTDVPVALVSFESTPGEVLDAVRETLSLAGAQVTGQLTLSDRMDMRSAPDREALSSALGTSFEETAELSDALAAQLTAVLTGQNADVLTRLLEAELASAPIAIQPEQQARVVILVGGETSRELNERVALPLARGLGESQAVAAAVESGTGVRMLGPIRDDSDARVVTVDSVETPLGQSAMALGIRAALAGQFGHYGRGEGATPALPVAET